MNSVFALPENDSLQAECSGNMFRQSYLHSGNVFRQKGLPESTNFEQTVLRPKKFRAMASQFPADPIAPTRIKPQDHSIMIRRAMQPQEEE